MGGILKREVERIDRLFGASGRSIQSLEALWSNKVVPWAEAYATAQERAELEAHDQRAGKSVSFLEGFELAARILMPGQRAIEVVRDHFKPTGSSRRTDDPGMVWIRFGEDDWSRLKSRLDDLRAPHG